MGLSCSGIKVPDGWLLLPREGTAQIRKEQTHFSDFSFKKKEKFLSDFESDVCWWQNSRGGAKKCAGLHVSEEWGGMSSGHSQGPPRPAPLEP